MPTVAQLAPHTLDLQVDLLRAESGSWRPADGAVVFADGEDVLVRITNRGGHRLYCALFLRTAGADARAATREITALPMYQPAILGAATPIRLAVGDEAIVVAISDEPDVLTELLAGAALQAPEDRGFALLDAPVTVAGETAGVDVVPDRVSSQMSPNRPAAWNVLGLRVLGDVPLSAAGWRTYVPLVRELLNHPAPLVRHAATEVAAGAPLQSLREYVRGVASDRDHQDHEVAWQALADARDPAVLPDLLGDRYDPLRLAGYVLSADQLDALPDAARDPVNRLWTGITYARSGDFEPLDAALHADRPLPETMDLAAELLPVTLAGLGPLPYQLIFQLRRLLDHGVDEWAVPIVEALLLGSQGPRTDLGGLESSVGAPDQGSAVFDEMTAAFRDGSVTALPDLLDRQDEVSRGWTLAELLRRTVETRRWATDERWVEWVAAAFDAVSFSGSLPVLRDAYLAARAMAREVRDPPSRRALSGLGQQVAWLACRWDFARVLDDERPEQVADRFAFARDVIDLRRSRIRPSPGHPYRPARALPARRIVDDRRQPPARTVTISLDRAHRPLRVGRTAHVDLSIHTADPDAPAVDAAVSVILLADDCAISPSTHTVRMPTAESVRFDITPRTEGLLDLRFRLLTARASVLLQEIATQLPVLPADDGADER